LFQSIKVSASKQQELAKGVDASSNHLWFSRE
jgi:hypothetical protein